MIARVYRRLRREQRPVRFLASRLLWRSGACRALRIDCGRFRLRFFPTALSASYWLNPDERRADSEVFERLVGPGALVVDVGANIGYLSLLASTLTGAAGKVIAVEPHPRTFSFLQRNVRLNGRGNITMHNCAIGESEGVVTLSDRRTDDQNQVRQGTGLDVPMRTLDVLLADVSDTVDLLKVDVEGFERFVFRGARSVLARTRHVYFECSDALCQTYGYRAQDLVEEVQGMGFDVETVAGERVDATRLAGAKLNLIAIARSHP